MFLKGSFENVLIKVSRRQQKHEKQGLHRLEKYLNLKDFLEKSLKIKYALKSTGKSFKGLEMYLNSATFCRI